MRCPTCPITWATLWKAPLHSPTRICRWAAAGALSTSFLGQYINRKGVRNVILVSAFWCFVGLMLFSFSKSLWMFYGIAAVMGLFCTSCMSLCANVIVQTSYSGDQASNLLGFVMAGSGVGGMVFSMILPGILEKQGWRFGYRFLAVCWILFVLLAYVLLMVGMCSMVMALRDRSQGK